MTTVAQKLSFVECLWNLGDGNIVHYSLFNVTVKDVLCLMKNISLDYLENSERKFKFQLYYYHKLLSRVLPGCDDG